MLSVHCSKVLKYSLDVIMSEGLRQPNPCPPSTLLPSPVRSGSNPPHPFPAHTPFDCSTRNEGVGGMRRIGSTVSPPHVPPPSAPTLPPPPMQTLIPTRPVPIRPVLLVPTRRPAPANEPETGHRANNTALVRRSPSDSDGGPRPRRRLDVCRPSDVRLSKSGVDLKQERLRFRPEIGGVGG